MLFSLLAKMRLSSLAAFIVGALCAQLQPPQCAWPMTSADGYYQLPGSTIPIKMRILLMPHHLCTLLTLHHHSSHSFSCNSTSDQTTLIKLTTPSTMALQEHSGLQHKIR